MASESMSWGVELGASAIKALKLGVSSDGSVEVLDFAIIPHKKVLSTPGLDVDDAMRVAVGQLASQYDLENTPIAVSIPGHQAFARFAKLPPVDPKGVPNLVKFEAVQQIPFDLSEVEWDYQTFMSPDSPDIEVGIFAITKQRIERELMLLRDVGLSPDAVNVAPVSAYNAMAHDLQFTEKTPGTVIMDVGTTSTDLIIADAGRVWMRTFPIGGHHFTEALVDKFKLSYAKAERLKREAERSKHSRHVFQAMKGVFADLAQETQRSIGYHSSLHPDADLKRIIGVGSTFKLPGLRRFLKQQLQLDVYRMDEFKRVSLDGPRAGEFGAVTLEMTVAYGLALQGLGMPTIDANLMPVAIMRDGMWGRKTKWFGMAAGLSLAASAAMFINWMMDNNAVSSNTAPSSIRNVVNQANSLKNEASDAGVTGEAVTDADAQALLALPNGRELMSYVVADLGQVVGWSNAQVASWQATNGSGPDEAFEVLSYTMAYSAGSNAGGDGGGGRPRQNAVAAEPGPYDGKPMIKVTLDIQTTQANAQPFLFATVLPWLAANAEREGVPYVILETDRLNYQSAGLASNGRSSRNNSQDTRGGFGGDTYSEFDSGEMDDRMTDEQRRREARGGGGAQRNQSRTGQPAITGSIDELAPLPFVEETEYEQPTQRYTIEWTLAVVPPEERIGAQDEMQDGGTE